MFGVCLGKGANFDILDSFQNSAKLWKTDRDLGAHAPHHVLSSTPEVGRLTTYVELRTMIGQDERWRLWSSFPSKFLVPSPPMLRSTSRTKNIVASTPAISSMLLVVRKRETFHRPEIGYFSCANRIYQSSHSSVSKQTRQLNTSSSLPQCEIGKRTSCVNGLELMSGRNSPKYHWPSNRRKALNKEGHKLPWSARALCEI